MPAILGNIIAVAIILVIVYFCGKNVVEMIRGELSGKGCAGCSGGCSGSCTSCSGCSSSTPGTGKQHDKAKK